MKFKNIFFSLIIFCFSAVIYADELAGAGIPDNAYLNGGESGSAVILCHGRGKYPTWDVVNPLRKGIHKNLGYHTVSLQMPAPGGNWRSYAEYFPDAYASISATVKVLQQKGIKNIYLMGHSMGSRMTTAYLANTEEHGIKGFIGIGIRNGGGEPLDSAANLEFVSIPVVDIYGNGGDGKDERHAERREQLLSASYNQVLISGADHRFNGHEDEMVNAVVSWLKRQ